jgi:hypothetical protein
MYVQKYEPESRDEERVEERVVRAVSLGIMADLARGRTVLHQLSALRIATDDAPSSGIMTTGLLIDGLAQAAAKSRAERSASFGHVVPSIVTAGLARSKGSSLALAAMLGAHGLVSGQGAAEFAAGFLIGAGTELEAKVEQAAGVCFGIAVAIGGGYGLESARDGRAFDGVVITGAGLEIGETRPGRAIVVGAGGDGRGKLVEGRC